MRRVVVSIVIGAVLVLQAAASFALLAPLTRRGAHWLWPFLDYPMYSRAYREGASVERPVVIGTLPDGREVEVRPADLGINFWRFQNGVVEMLRRGDYKWLAVHADLYRARQGTPLVRLRLESRPLVVARDGVRPGVPAVLAEAELPGSPR